MLLTLGDTEERRRYLNARSTIDTLLDWRAVPVINENDTVATSEIRYGDNDRLAARVATMASADLLVLLSDIDGLYTRRPATGSEREAHPAWCARITPEIEAMAGGAGVRAVARRHAHQDRGRQDRDHRRHAHDDRVRQASSIRCGRSREGGRCTWFLDAGQPGHRAQELDRRLAGAAGHARHRCRRGRGAARRQEPAAGRREARRRPVRRAAMRCVIAAPTATRSAAASSPTTPTTPRRIAGRSSPDVMTILGIGGRAEMIHRDDLVVGPAGRFRPNRPSGRPAGTEPTSRHAGSAPRQGRKFHATTSP